MDKYLELLGFREMPEFLVKYMYTPSLLRLKNICYFCGMDYASKDIYDFKGRITRYDHSLFVALITWKLTGDRRATLAGLFHDISTPCFSHVIDYMNKDYEKQESTEEKVEEIIRSDYYLLECLKRDNILVDEIIDFKRYSIVDNERPKLCADRLDGVILTGYGWTKSITIDDIEDIVSDLIVVLNDDNEKEIGFRTERIARLVVDTSELIDLYCHSKEDNFMMELLAGITRRAIEIGVISYDDLYLLDEDSLFGLLDNSLDKEIVDNLYLFRNVKCSEIVNIDIPMVKIRVLKPIVGNKRI